MDLYIYGAGGNGREIYNILKWQQKMDVVFDNFYFLDKNLKGTSVNNIPVFSLEEVIENRELKDYQVLISPSDPKVRLEMYQLLKKNNISLFSNIQNPHGFSSLGEGVVDCGCHAFADVSIGNACLLGTNAVISHDVSIGEGTYIGVHSFIGGGCTIGSGVMIAPGAVIRHNIKIADESIIGMGSVVLKNVPERSFVMGASASVILKDKSLNHFD